jgi:hypothetical protein
MRIGALLLPAIALLAQTAGAAAAEQRPAFSGVSAIRIANYGAPSVLLDGRAKVAPIVSELNALAKGPWRRGETKLSCYSTIVLLKGAKPVGQLRVTAEHVVERPVEKGQSSYSLAIGETDLSSLRAALAEILPAKGCD